MAGFAAIGVFIIYLFIALITLTVIYHHVAYAISKPSSKIILSSIIVVSLVMTVATFVIFISVPWEGYSEVFCMKYEALCM